MWFSLFPLLSKNAFCWVFFIIQLLGQKKKYYEPYWANTKQLLQKQLSPHQVMFFVTFTDFGIIDYKYKHTITNAIQHFKDHPHVKTLHMSCKRSM